MNQNQMILSRARDKVARRWVQGAAVDNYGGVCAGYAIQSSITEVAGRVPDTTGCPCPGCNSSSVLARCAGLLLEAVYQQTGTRWYDIPPWNDHHSTTKADVLAVFDLAIRLAADKAEDETEDKIEVAEPKVMIMTAPLYIPPSYLPTSLTTTSQVAVGMDKVLVSV